MLKKLNYISPLSPVAMATYKLIILAILHGENQTFVFKCIDVMRKMTLLQRTKSTISLPF